MKTTDALTLSEFYAAWLTRLQAQPLSSDATDAFNADIQASIEVPYRDAAVKTELAQIKLGANRWFHSQARMLAK